MKHSIKYISYIVLSALLAITVACNKKLDVQPGQEIVPQQIQTEDDVQAVLLGGYSSLQDANAFGERYLLMADLLVGKIGYAGSFTNYKEVFTHTIQTNNTIPVGMWGKGYGLINAMNLVLSHLNLVSDDNKAAVSAEAKFMRAVAYYELAGFFGLPYSAGNITQNPTVPIISQAFLLPSDLPASKQPRATVDVLYKQVIADLKDAAENLPENYADKRDKPRATKYAASAFLSRVYMAQGDYKAAATAADAVIQSGLYTLMPSWELEFNNTAVSSEDIFAIVQTSQSNAGIANGGLVTFYALDQRNEIYLPDGQIDQYEDVDQRKNFYTYDPVYTSVVTTSKWKDLYGTIPVVRLAEMYLTRAEANLRAGTTIGDTPLNDINAVRERSKATPLTTVTPDDVVNERNLELCFEGDWFWTVKRLKLDVEDMPYDDNTLVFPIPQRELDVNPLLEQNPGY